MNESRFPFVLDMIVLNLLDENRRTYSLYRTCVLSLIILLALRSTCFSYKAVTEDCLKPVILQLTFTTRCNLFLSFWLTFPNQHIKQKICKTSIKWCYQRAKFSEAEKTLLTFLVRDTAVAVPLQPIVNYCAEVFILANYLYIVIVDDSVRLGWRVFPKNECTCLWFLLRSDTNTIYHTVQQSLLTHDHGQLHR